MPSIILDKLRFGSHINNIAHHHHSKDDASHSTSSSATAYDEMGLPTSKQAEAVCIAEIKEAFRKFGIRLPQEKVFRYAHFCNYNTEEAVDRIREDNGNPYMQLSMKHDLAEQFATKALFPLPDLRTRKTNTEVIYMNPSRVYPNQGDENIDRFIDSLCFVLNDLAQTVDQCRNGVTIIADMKDVTMDNFNKEYCVKMMQAMQGDMVPTRVDAFLIVNPPSWFHKIFKWMKSKKVSKDFLKRVHQIKDEEHLKPYLMSQPELYLPDGLCGGHAVGAELCEDYMDLKIAQERRQQERQQ